MPRQDNTKRLQPRTDREQLLVDAIVEHHLAASELNPRTARERRIVAEAERDADEIRAARQNMRDRVGIISPYYSEEKKAHGPRTARRPEVKLCSCGHGVAEVAEEISEGAWLQSSSPICPLKAWDILRH